MVWRRARDKASKKPWGRRRRSFIGSPLWLATSCQVTSWCSKMAGVDVDKHAAFPHDGDWQIFWKRAAWPLAPPGPRRGRLTPTPMNADAEGGGHRQIEAHRVEARPDRKNNHYPDHVPYCQVVPTSIPSELGHESDDRALPEPTLSHQHLALRRGRVSRLSLWRSPLLCGLPRARL